MKNSIVTLLLLVFFSFTNTLQAQNQEFYPIVSIKAYKNAYNKKVAKKPIKAEQILDLPNIKLYRAYSNSTMRTNIGPMAGGGGSIYTNVDVSDTFWYCLRPGEDVATMISWTFNTQINKNNVFRKNAQKYFKDSPGLSNKIKNRDYKHSDIIQVVEDYNSWKSGN